MGKSKQQRLGECIAVNRIISEAAEKINRLANAPLSAPSTAKSSKAKPEDRTTSIHK